MLFHIKNYFLFLIIFIFHLKVIRYHFHNIWTAKTLFLLFFLFEVRSQIRNTFLLLEQIENRLIEFFAY